MSGEARPDSVILGRDPEVLRQMLDFYASPGARVVDVTANDRRMWEGVLWTGEITYADLDERVKPDVVADFRKMPWEDGSFDVIVFDPPHLPSAAASPKSLASFGKRYGLGLAPGEDNVSSYFPTFLVEAARVLRPNGLIFAKLKDYVHNHRYQWMLAAFVGAVQVVPGLTACDLIVKRDPSAGSLKSGRWVKAHHVRNCHTWWVVVRKGRCES